MVKNISYDNLIGLFPNAFELNYDKIVKIDKDKHNKRITILLLESIKFVGNNDVNCEIIPMVMIPKKQKAICMFIVKYPDGTKQTFGKV